jgi:hypothetical protein
MGLDFGLMLAQLRDVLAAENSAVMAQENDYGWPRFPQRAEPDRTFIGIGEGDFVQPGAKIRCCYHSRIARLALGLSLTHSASGSVRRTSVYPLSFMECDVVRKP